MSNHFLTSGIFLSIILFAVSCENSIMEPQFKADDYKNYFPAKTGQSFIYDLRFISIDAPSGIYDTSNYFIKEVFSEFFIDNLGDSAIKIERYIRETETDAWRSFDIWFANVYEDELHVVEENIRYVKLKNPVEEGNEWDGNKYNATDSLNLFNYSMQTISSELINGILYDSVLTVLQRYDSSLIDKILFQEKYAKNIGLIYKEKTTINSQNPNVNIPIENRITTGTIYKMSLISYTHAY